LPAPAAAALVWIDPHLPASSGTWVTAVAIAAVVAVVTGLSARISRAAASARLLSRASTIGVALVVPLAALVALHDGGLRSPAIWMLALSAAACSVDMEPRGAITSALLTSALGLLVQLRSSASLGATEWMVIVALFVTVAAPSLLRRASTPRSEARTHGVRLDSMAARGTTPGQNRAIEPASGPRRSPPTDRVEPLTEFVRGLATSFAAHEVTVWRWSDDGLALVPAASSAPTASTPTESAAAQLLWVARERMLHCDGDGEVVRLAATPVLAADQTIGAISLHAPAGLSVDRQALKLWLPTLAAQAARLCELDELRREHGRQRAQTRILIKAAREFQSLDSAERLGEALCETMLAVTSARRAALVRWYADEQRGEVQSVSADHWIDAGARVSSASRVAACCADGSPEVWPDASWLGDDRVVYGFGEGRSTAGSLAIVPLERDRRIIGAIVLEGDGPDGALDADLRSVRLSAALAVGSLQAFWQVAEMTHSAFTDKLTGISNRRHFDLQFTRVLSESTRFRTPCTLIVADIDHFKRVNDEHGHEAGDSVLKAVAAAIGGGVRDIDICARIGGEELAVLLPQTGATDAREVAERLRRSLAARPVRYKGREIAVSASFGIASFPESTARRDQLFPAADRALYQAKAEGRNCVRVAPATTSGKAT
jgi:diguanylate cyclase (GGDEF)-like protein